jgi:two-component system phosphate regulon sensor histidine kinase PhoR
VVCSLAAAVCALLIAATIDENFRLAGRYDVRWALTGGGLLLVVAAIVLAGRSLMKSQQQLSRQIEEMAEEGHTGLVMVAPGDVLEPVARAINGLLSSSRGEMEQLRTESRELQLQARIAAAEKKQTEAIIFSISDAVIVTNRFDELLLANESAEQLLGFKLDEALRKNIDRIVTDGTLVRLIQETRAHGRSFTRKVVEHTIDDSGSPRTFNVTLSCVVSPTREVNGVVAVLHDVTREKEISQLKTDFVSNVSHELKTPLSSIKAYVEMLVDGEADDEQTRAEFYEIISAETDRLHRLIENILNISRIESGVIKVTREPVSLTEIVKQALDVIVPQARAKDQQLDNQLAPVFYQVEGDRDMIYQAVLNLASNAVKYTPQGGTVSVRTSVDERRGVAVCEVCDTGMGIPADDLPNIFDKFFRVGANTKAAKGTGLGLTLVKHIIETVHDGTLSVTSEAGKGSTFSFELPVIR